MMKKLKNKSNLDKSSHEGHRSRIKEKYLNANSGSFLDYELLELLLCYSNPRKDMKTTAKKLLNQYGDLLSIINSSPDKLKQFHGIGTSAIVLFKLISEISSKISFEEVNKKNIMSSWPSLMKYLKLSTGYKENEVFRVIFLNKNNEIISDEVLNSGTIDQVAVYPREILKRAILHDASAIFLIHNHPSGNEKPSLKDIDMTNDIIQALKPLNIVVHDHVIITKKQYFSFSANGLIK